MANHPTAPSMLFQSLVMRPSHNTTAPCYICSMKLNGTYCFDIPREQLWDSFFDPAVLGACIPGIRNFTTLSPDRYEIEIALRVGIFSGAYKGTIEVVEKDVPASCRVIIQGTGVRTDLKGEGVVVLTAEDGATTLTFDVDMQVTGVLARVGQRLMGSVSKAQFDRFFQCLHSKVAKT